MTKVKYLVWSKSIREKIPSNRQLKTVLNARWILENDGLFHSKFTSEEFEELSSVADRFRG